MSLSLANNEGAIMRPRYSVVIPTFNRLEMLLEAIGSVDAQTYRDYEIIVSDDGSSDGTLEALKASRPDIKLIDVGGKGPGGARNAGIRAARGKYVSLLDSDDIWHPKLLETVTKALEGHPTAALVVLAESRFCDGEEPTFSSMKGSRTDLYENIHTLATTCPGFTGTAVWGAVRRDTFLKVGGFHEERDASMEDLDWLLLAGAEGPAVRIAEPPLVAYRLHRDQMTKDPMPFYRGVQMFLARQKAGVYPEAYEADRNELIARMVALPIRVMKGKGSLVNSLRLIWLSIRTLGGKAALPHVPRQLACAMRAWLQGLTK
jgi:glycosyltransferase involved in cell wall biosynthesis